VCDIVVKMFTFAISSLDEFLFISPTAAADQFCSNCCWSSEFVCLYAFNFVKDGHYEQEGTKTWLTYN